jgi:hypothetical protein
MDSPELILLGQVSGKVDAILSKQAEQTEHIGKLFTAQDELRSALAKLPCATHSEKLGEIMEWQGCHNGIEKEEKSEKFKAMLTLKNGLLLAAAGCAGSVLTGIVVWWLTWGCKGG